MAYNPDIINNPNNVNNVINLNNINNYNNQPFIIVDNNMLDTYINDLNNFINRASLARYLNAELDWHILMNEPAGNIPCIQVRNMYNELLAVRNIVYTHNEQDFLDDFVNLFLHMDLDWLRVIQI